MKSQEEKRMRDAMADYEKHFGERYVFDFGGPSMTMEETTAEIRRLIAENKKQEIPEYSIDDDILI